MYNYTYIHITNELAIITNDLIDKSINHLAHELIDKPSSKPKCMSISKLKLNKKPKPQKQVASGLIHLQAINAMACKIPRQKICITNLIAQSSTY